MLDYGEYIIDEPYRQYGNGYDQLQGECVTYYKVASKYVHKAKFEDRDDVLHTIILNLAVVGRSNGHKPDNPSWMYRIASFTVAQYWRDYYKRINGIDCGHCSNPQRKRCKALDKHKRQSGRIKYSIFSECCSSIRIKPSCNLLKCMSYLPVGDRANSIQSKCHVSLPLVSFQVSSHDSTAP